MKKTLLIFCFLPCLLFAKDSWKTYKEKTIQQMSEIPGWCTEEKALFMMDFIKKNRCKYCVEIGVFSGKSLFPIAKTLAYKKSGVVVGIDAWNSSVAVHGFDPLSLDYQWWNQVDYSHFNDFTLKLIAENSLSKYCKIVKNNSLVAVSTFKDNTIDFLHIDGSHAENPLYDDAVLFLPKVKNGGYILLNNATWRTSKQALVYLLERTELISTFEPTANYYVFKKNQQYGISANALLK
jgi:predicted O-methyltransferase YrrM